MWHAIQRNYLKEFQLSKLRVLYRILMKIQCVASCLLSWLNIFLTISDICNITITIHNRIVSNLFYTRKKRTLVADLYAFCAQIAS